MERIQAAIQKAKERRAEQGTDTRESRAPTPRTVKARSAIDTAQATALWASLPAIHPDIRVLRKNRIVAATREDIAHVTFDMMRTKLLKTMRAEGWSSLAISSPSAECGKTFTAINLAYSLARQADVRTMLFDLDMRRPQVARMLEIREPHAMEAVLSGAAPAEDHLVRIGDNLAVGTNHRSSPNPAELLQDKGTGQILDEIRRRFQPDIMIFDLPPMLATDDVMAFLPHVDCALLVAAAASSTTEEVDICERDLAENTNMLGVILNKCRYMPDEYSYNYNYA